MHLQLATYRSIFQSATVDSEKTNAPHLYLEATILDILCCMYISQVRRCSMYLQANPSDRWGRENTKTGKTQRRRERGSVRGMENGRYLLVFAARRLSAAHSQFAFLSLSCTMMTRSAALIALGVVLRQGCDGFGVGRPTTARCSERTGAGMRRTRGWSVRCG